MLLVTKESTRHFAQLEAGGKGLNLYLLTQNNLPVPKWNIIGPSVFVRFLESAKIKDKIQFIIDDVHTGAEQKATDIHHLITSSPFQSDVREFIVEAWNQLHSPLIAVRSSALDKDSAAHSFAGQLSSFLYIKNVDKMLEAVKECWASLYSERSLIYRQQNGLPTQNIKVAVILQEMIPAEKSGVLFTCNPITEDPNQMTINSVFGVGEGLVSGALDADTFILSKENGMVLQREIVEKKSQFLQDFENETTKEMPVSESMINQSSLSDGELSMILRLGKVIEDSYRFPQDVEWAIHQGKVYILQSRPVTSQVINKEGQLFIWDNSNIVESYGGITMPLTFGFAHYVYHQVYVQFCEILQVPNKHIREMDYFLKNMLGLFYGRVYYNLLNWYKLTNILPGYKYNRKFMETMMGTNESLQDEIAERVRPPAFQDSNSGKWRKFRTGIKFFYYHLNIQKVVDDFLTYFHSVYNQFRKKDYSQMPSDLIYEDYLELERKLLWRWHAPIINDFLCMVHFGMFKKITEKWLGHLGGSFQNDLMAGNGNLESAEPTKVLIQMAGYVTQHPELKELILKTSSDHCLEALTHSSYKEFYGMVLSYIDRFGFRCMSEMKLEQKDLHQDPSLLFVFLKNLINSGQTNLHTYEERERQIRDNAENLLKQNLSGPKKWFYNWSLFHARKAVRNRENTRFCRTRIYGIVRSMFFGMGRDFAQRKIIMVPEDIFYLSLDELKGSLEGTNSIQNLQKVVQLRKEEYAIYAQGEEPAPRFHTRGLVYWQNRHFPIEEKVEIDESSLGPNQLKGIPCCPGIVEGVVKVILDPKDNMELNGEILVTYRTDPGWIPLYPSASALIVERGGLLSHSAIVAREMGLPAIVSVKGLIKKLKTGMKIRMNGETGLIEILEEES